MKRRFTILLAAFALLVFMTPSIVSWGQDTQTVTLNIESYAQTHNWQDATRYDEAFVSPVTFTAAGGANTGKYYENGQNWRFYQNEQATLTISISNVFSLTSIKPTFTNSNNGTLLYGSTALTSGNVVNVSGTSVVFSVGNSGTATNGQIRITEIEVAYVAAGDTPTTYTVTYDCNGGTSGCPDPSTLTVDAGTQIELADAPSKDGYDFDGWSDGTTTYGENEDYTVNGNVTFTAQWTENTTPTPGGGTATLNIQTYAEANNWENGVKYTTATVAPVTFTANGGGNTGKYYTNGQDWRFYQGESASITITVPDGYTLVSVTPTYTVSNTGVLKNGDATIASGTTVSVSGTSVTFTVGNTGTATNGQVRFTNIDVVYVSEGGVIPPSITANNVEIAYDATSGDINYTINNPVEGGTITATVEVDSWIQNVVVYAVNNMVMFDCDQNQNGTARTATVTLSYMNGNDVLATKEVTVTQAGNPNATMTIAEVRTLNTGTIVVTKGIVTSISVSGNNKTAYMQDNTAGIVAYGPFTTEVAVGDEIRVEGELTEYHGLLEIGKNNAAPTVTVLSQNNTVTPVVKTIEEISNDIQAQLVTVEDVTVTNIDGQNTTIAQGQNTIVVRGISGVEYAVNDVLTLTANVGCYDNPQLVNPTNVTVQQILIPSLTVTPTTVNFAATTGDEEILMENLTIAYENIEITNYQSFTVQFYDNQGNETEMSWLVAGVTGTNEEGYVVRCVTTDNDGEARTAYFKVYAYDADDNKVYSELVTVNQAGYVAPVEGDKYVKVTSTEDLTNGQYLIVYEDGNVAFNGGLDELDVANNTIDVTISNDEITATNVTTAAEFTIDITAGTIMSASGYYIGRTASSNGMNYSETTAYTNTISFDEDDNAVITSTGGPTLRYNDASNQNRFRYYASGQKAIQLYKKVESATETYTLEIGGYAGDGGYYLIASPVTVDLTNHDMTTGDFDLYSFDEGEEDEWRNYKADAFNTLVPGTGYLYAKKATNDTQTYSFELTGIPYNEDGEIELSYTDGAEFAGYNLIGNPFNTNATLDMPYYRLNENGSALNTSTESSQINVMEGVFVQATADITTAHFTAAGSKMISQLNVKVTRNRGAVLDNAIIRFDNGAMLGKFQLNPNSTKIYITEGNEDYAIVRSAGEAEMPVSFKAAENGTYTLSVVAENVEMNYLHLIDNVTGKDIDLLATPSYSFEASTADYASRFRLVFNANSLEESSDFAFFNGSEWVVSNMGDATLQVIDMTGRVISSETVNGNVTFSTNGLTAGVYMMRLVNGNDVKIQKVLVK